MFCATALAVRRRPGNLDDWVQSQAGPCGICGVQTRNGAVFFSPSSSTCSCRIITRMTILIDSSIIDAVLSIVYISQNYQKKHLKYMKILVHERPNCEVIQVFWDMTA
jgi:hypothetical protein